MYYRFGKNQTTKNSENGADGEAKIQVGAEDLYTREKGYGFVTEASRQGELFSHIDAGDNFRVSPWYQNEGFTHLRDEAIGVFLDSDEAVNHLEEITGEAIPGEKRYVPLCFRADVPKQGLYRLTVTVEAEGELIIYTNRRRLVVRQRESHGEQSFSVLTAVHDIIPRAENGLPGEGLPKIHVSSIDVVVISARPCLKMVKIEPAEGKILFLGGDSTVTDQPGDIPYAPGVNYCAWGQMIGSLLGDRMAVSNAADSGLTTESFRNGGYYSLITDYVRPGDYVALQFGHNDQKLAHLQAEGGYKKNLLRYIEELKALGAKPVLVTSLARNSRYPDGTYHDMLKKEAAVVRQLGQDTGVPVLDLHARSLDYIMEHGDEGSFSIFHPGDRTHTNDNGAYMMAGFLAEEIKKTCCSLLDYADLAESIQLPDEPWAPSDHIVATEVPAYYKKRNADLTARVNIAGS